MKPSFQDADIVLRLYELRREVVMRESRDMLNQKFLPKNFDDVKEVMTNFTNPLNRPFRQVSTYWEMAYGMARHEIVVADYLAETSAEGFLLFVKIAPYLEQIRKEISSTAFTNTEWLANNSAVAEQRIGLMRKRIEAVMAGFK